MSGIVFDPHALARLEEACGPARVIEVVPEYGREVWPVKRTRWTKEAAIAAVRRFHAEHGYQPVSREAGRHHGLPGCATARRLFGSWNAMLEAAGCRPYPARSSAQAKTMAYADRHPGWRPGRK